MDKDIIIDSSLGDATIPFRLSEIQRRCAALLETPGAIGLALEDPFDKPETNNPYDLG